MRVLCITEDLDRPTTALFIGLQRHGIHMAVICPPGSVQRPQLEQAGIALPGLEFRRRVDRDAVAALRRMLIDERYDVLHVFSNKAVQNGLMAVKGLPIRVVAYRGIVGNVSFFNPVSWMRFLNPRIDRIICVCHAIRDFFLAMRPAFLRMPPSRPITIYKGHSLDWYGAAPARREDLGISDEAFLITCVANYRPRKGIEYLVQAVAALPAAIDAQLLLIGHMDSPRLDRVIRDAGAEARVRRLGYRADAPSLTAAADVFVLPSTEREGLARSLIEAMAYAVAPVVTNCGGSPELVIDGQSGLVVPVRNGPAMTQALARLHADPALRVRLGQAAQRRIAEDFRIEDTIAQTLAVYEELVGPVIRPAAPAVADERNPE